MADHLFGYPAGKVRFAASFVQKIPNHDTYVEPFCGSAAVFFAKPRSKVEALCDLSGEVIEVLRDVRDLSDADVDLIRRLDWTSSRDRYVQLLRRDPRSRVARVHRFLYLARYSVVRGYFSRSRENGYDTAEAGKDLGRFFLKRIEFARERLRGVEIKRGDYQKIVERYDSENTFFFFDPPYLGTHSRFPGGNDFDEQRFERVLRGIKGRFVVTYGTGGKANFEGFDVEIVEHVRAINSSRWGNGGGGKTESKRTELLVSNFGLSKINKAASDGFDWTGLGCDVCGYGTIEDVEKFDPEEPCPDCGATMCVPMSRTVEDCSKSIGAVLPAVLSDGAPMPREGVSALPESLEADVPEAFRYWTKKGEDARITRDALVRSGLFKESNVAIVDGELRRIEHVATLPDPIESETFEDRISKVFGDAVRLFDVGVIDEEAIAKIEEVVRVSTWDGASVFMAEDCAHAREELAKLGTVFELVPAPGFFEQSEGKIFASKSDIRRFDLIRKAPHNRTRCMLCKSAPEIDCVWADGRGRAWFCKACFDSWRKKSEREIVRVRQVEGSVPEKFGDVAKSEPKIDLFEGMPEDMPIVKSKRGEEERFVFGVVLEPETADSQGDIYSADEVRSAAHKFLERFQNIGLQHQKIINGHVRILESFVAPSDFNVGAQKIKKGTWLLAVRVLSDALWNDVKSGNITGFSIGGSARRIPLRAA